jgi:peptidoglycan/xylan/chitin deacetylase (PgdA/CDA1 family)
MEANAESVIRAFLRNNVPLTVGIITGATPTLDCYANWLKPLYDSTTFIELSSHSVTHKDLTLMTYDEQLYEIQFSKNKIETLFSTTITLFLPPYNRWNTDTVRALNATGYTTFSPQCTIGTPNAPAGDMCTTNMYPNVRPAFFPPIDGLIHIPVGCATTKMDDTGGALPPADVVNGASARCLNEGVCSIASQMEGMTHVTDPTIGTFAVVMMHPADFSDDAFIQNYFNDLLSQVKPLYDIRTVSNLPK